MSYWLFYYHWRTKRNEWKKKRKREIITGNSFEAVNLGEPLSRCHLCNNLVEESLAAEKNSFIIFSYETNADDRWLLLRGAHAATAFSRIVFANVIKWSYKDREDLRITAKLRSTAAQWPATVVCCGVCWSVKHSSDRMRKSMINFLFSRRSSRVLLFISRKLASGIPSFHHPLLNYPKSYVCDACQKAKVRDILTFLQISLTFSFGCDCGHGCAADRNQSA